MKQPKMKHPSRAFRSSVKAPDDPAPIIEPTNGSASPEDVARLAYEFWEARGCPDGSPEEDWFRAENELHRERRGKATAA